MSEPSVIKIGETAYDGVDTDFPLLACRAGIELDNLILGRSQSVGMIKRLVRQLELRINPYKITENHPIFLDPTAVVVVNRAFAACDWLPSMRKVDELVRGANNITKTFKTLIENPVEFKTKHAEEIKQLKFFCLALSKSASGYERPRDHHRTPNPFRK